MFQSGNCASLGQIRLGIASLLESFGIRNLDGHLPMQLVVIPQIDAAESSYTKDPIQAIATFLPHTNSATTDKGPGKL